MNDSEKLDFLINLVNNINTRIDNIEQKLQTLESAQKDSENHSTEDTQYLHKKMKAISDVNLRNARRLGDSVEELRGAINVTRRETVSLTKHVVAQESFDKSSEEKNVAVFNITNTQIAPFRDPKIKEQSRNSDEAVKLFLNKLAHETIDSLNEGDIRSIKTIDHWKTPKGYHSAVISFVSVGDAQKFSSRINKKTNDLKVSNGPRQHRKSLMCSRLGLSMLQRNLLSNADYVMEQEDTQGILTKSKSRKNAIRSLTDCDALWNPTYKL